MALNNEFKVKDTINVGVSGIFGRGIRIGTTDEYPITDDSGNLLPAIDAWSPILSGGIDLGEMIGDGVDGIYQGDSVQGSIRYQTQNDALRNPTVYTTVEALGLQTSDSPTFTNLSLNGDGTLATIAGPASLVLDPGGQATPMQSTSYTQSVEETALTDTVSVSGAPGTGLIDVTITGDGSSTVQELLDALAADAGDDVQVTAGDNVVVALNETLNFTGGIDALADANAGTVVIKGNLQIDGTTTTVNSTTLDVDDINITVAKGAADAAAANNAGLYVDGAGATILYGQTGSWSLNQPTTILGSGTAAAVITSNGAQDLTLNTNGGTNSGSISITDAANGNISIAPNGTGKVVVGGTAPTISSVAALKLETTADNTNIELAPHGSGDVTLSTDTVTIGSGTAQAAENVTIETKALGSLTLRTDGGAGGTSSSIVIGTGADSDITLTPNGAGDVKAVADTFVLGGTNEDATITTNGTGDLTLNTNGGSNSGSIQILDGANGNISITPNGSGDINLSSDTVYVGGTNEDVTITTVGTGDLTLSTNSGTDSGTITIADGTAGSITLTPDTTGDVELVTDTVKLGSANENATVTTNGTGDLTLNTNSGNNSGSIVIADGSNGDVTVTTDGTGEIVQSTAGVVLTDGTSQKTDSVFTSVVTRVDEATDVATLTIDTVALADHDAHEVNVVLRDGTNVAMIKLMVVTDGSSVDGTAFAEVSTDSAITLGTPDVVVSNQKLGIKLTGATASDWDAGNSQSLTNASVTVTVKAIS